MKLRLTAPVARQLDRVLAYIDQHNPQGARHVQARIREVMVLLLQHPYAGHLRGQRVRRFALPRYPYLVFYRVNEGADEIEVLTVHDAARQEKN